MLQLTRNGAIGPCKMDVSANHLRKEQARLRHESPLDVEESMRQASGGPQSVLQSVLGTVIAIGEDAIEHLDEDFDEKSKLAAENMEESEQMEI